MQEAPMTRSVLTSLTLAAAFFAAYVAIAHGAEPTHAPVIAPMVQLAVDTQPAAPADDEVVAIVGQGWG
jgi:hypothetical protein